MAGSSLPVAWRMPPVDMPFGAAVEEVMPAGGPEFCHCADTPSPSLLKHLLNVEGGAAE